MDGWNYWKDFNEIHGIDGHMQSNRATEDTTVYELDPELGYVPAVPCPFYVWQRFGKQKVRCSCGEEFVTKDKSLVPVEYKRHYVLNHINPVS